MADRRERELLLGIFLMEAWDTAGAIEDELGLLTAPENPTAEALATLVVFAHRLKGSAALHGFPGVSELAAGTERLLERAPTASADERVGSAVFLEGLVDLLKEVFDGISAVGNEDSARIAEFKSRHPAFFASPAAAPGPEPAIALPPAPVSPLLADLRRFFTEGGEVLEYFVPEAAEHLESMTTALLAIEGGARDEDTLATVFRAAPHAQGRGLHGWMRPARRRHALHRGSSRRTARAAASRHTGGDRGDLLGSRGHQAGAPVRGRGVRGGGGAARARDARPAPPGGLGEPARAHGHSARGRGFRSGRRPRGSGSRADALAGAAAVRPPRVPGPARGSAAAGPPRLERGDLRAQHPGAGGAAGHAHEPGGGADDRAEPPRPAAGPARPGERSAPRQPHAPRPGRPRLRVPPAGAHDAPRRPRRRARRGTGSCATSPISSPSSSSTATTTSISWPAA